MDNKGTKTLETKRLLIRQYRIEDAEAMFRNWASDPEVTKYLSWPTHTDVNVSRNVTKDWIEHYSDPTWYNWAIELKEIGEIIGNIAVVKLDEDIEGAEIGYCLGRPWWGQEIMPETLKAVIAFLFDEVGLNRIAAYHDVKNPKSGRVMVKAGMKPEGILRAAARNNQGICDKAWYSILKEDR